MTVLYPKHAATVAWARKQIGQHEVPLGSNRGPFVQLCQAATWLAGTGWAWCRAFSLKAHLEGGFRLPDESAGAWDALDRAEKRGDALTPAQHTRAIPGDEVIWVFGSGHCSILEAVFSKGGQVWIRSIDGNVGDQVERCERPLSEVKGFIHWDELPTEIGHEPKPVKPPKAQVVGGVSGNRKLVVAKTGKSISLPAKPSGMKGVVRPAPKTVITGTTSNVGTRVTITTLAPKKTKPPTLPLLKKGAHGPSVKQLQQQLDKHGAKITIDGVFGARTLTSLKAFQRRSKLPVTGTTNARTWAKLAKGVKR